MAYSSWSVVFGEQPSAAKWNILGTNDADFNTKLTRAGMVVQIVSTNSSAVSTGTTVLPVDDTIPQNTEGDQYLTQAITPISATNQLIIEAVLHLSHTAVAYLSAALFQDTTANALAANNQYQTTATGTVVLNLRHVMTAGTTSSTTFKIRAGGSSAGTMTFNGNNATRFFNTVTKSNIKITEIVV